MGHSTVSNKCMRARQFSDLLTEGKQISTKAQI